MKTSVPLIISLVLLAGIIYFSDARQVVSALTAADPLYIAAGIGLWLLGAFLRIARWNGLLKHIDVTLTARNVASTFLAGFYLSIITPGKTGDPVRAVMLKRQHDLSFSHTLPSIIVERLADLVVMLTIAALGVLFLPPVIPKSYVYGMAAVFAIAMAGVVLTFSSQNRIRWLLAVAHRVFSFIPRIRRLEDRLESSSHKLASSFASYRDKKLLAKVFVMTIAIWLIEGGIGVLAFNAIGIDVPYVWVLTLIPIGTLAGVLSFLPGGLGSAELVGILFFIVVLGITPAQATAAALISRLMSYWMYVLVGSILLGKMKKL